MENDQNQSARIRGAGSLARSGAPPPRPQTQPNLTREEKLERFGEGPWLDEPDYLDWMRRDLHCVLTRHAELGHFLGYVGVPETHPFFGKTGARVEGIVHAPGGITYSAGCAYCGVWWFGFDCMHALDLVPAVQKAIGSIFRPGMGGRLRELVTYKSFAFVRDAVDVLAVQLLMIERGELP